MCIYVCVCTRAGACVSGECQEVTERSTQRLLAARPPPRARQLDCITSRGAHAAAAAAASLKGE